MNQKIEAIKEAIAFIKANWIDDVPHYWEGVPYEFVGATLFGGVTATDVKHLLKAKKDGEPIDLDGLDGVIKNNRLISVRVLK